MYLLQYCFFIFCIHFIEINGNPVEKVNCTNKKENGSIIWNDYCKQIGGICKDDNKTAHCECPSNKIFNNTTGNCTEIIIKCNDKTKIGKTWNEYCKQLGATCKDDNENAYCQCSPNKKFDLKTEKCIEKNTCSDDRENGETWNEYCEYRGAYCKDDNAIVRCACPWNRIFDDMTEECIEKVTCSNEREYGETWNEYCEYIGGYCEDDNAIVKCECYSNQIFDDMAESCIDIEKPTCYDERENGETWNDYCEELGGYCNDYDENVYCECSSNKLFNYWTRRCTETFLLKLSILNDLLATKRRFI